MVKLRYTLDHPDVHSMYRRFFNGVDKWNKHALGPRTVMHSIQTTEWWKRVFLTFLAACITNAWLAFKWHRVKLGLSAPDQNSFKKELAKQMMECRFEATLLVAIKTLRTHNIEVPFEALHQHSYYVGKKSKNSGLCCVCATRTALFCECGKPVCSVKPDKSCYAKHIAVALNIEQVALLRHSLGLDAVPEPKK